MDKIILAFLIIAGYFTVGIMFAGIFIVVDAIFDRCEDPEYYRFYIYAWPVMLCICLLVIPYGIISFITRSIIKAVRGD